MCDININRIETNQFSSFEYYDPFAYENAFYYTSTLMWFDKTMPELQILPSFYD
jgi:hypothetical protein